MAKVPSTVPLLITNRETGRELWTKEQCAEHCGVTLGSWRTYGRLHKIPPAAAYIGNVALWDSDEIKHWNAHRIRRPRNP